MSIVVDYSTDVSNVGSPLLELVQQVCDELMISRPTVVASSTDPQTRQLFALLNRLGTDIARQYPWQSLNREYVITTVADQTAYALPADWQSQIPQTEWDRTNRWPLLGPQSPQNWQSFKSGIVYAGPRERFRIQGNMINVMPAPPAGLQFSFEYISSGWVNSALGVAQSRYLLDSDYAVYPDSLLITGLKTQWKAAKGLDAGFDLAEFASLIEKMKAQDQSAPKLSLSPYSRSVLLSVANIADAGYGRE